MIRRDFHLGLFASYLKDLRIATADVQEYGALMPAT